MYIYIYTIWLLQISKATVKILHKMQSCKISDCLIAMNEKTFIKKCSIMLRIKQLLIRNPFLVKRNWNIHGIPYYECNEQYSIFDKNNLKNTLHLAN